MKKGKRLPSFARLLHILAFDVNRNLLRIATYDTEVAIVQIRRCPPRLHDLAVTKRSPI